MAMFAREGSVRFTPVAIAIIAAVLLGCQEESTGPSTADFNAERAAVAARAKKKSKKVVEAARPAPKAAAEEGGFGKVDQGFAYDPNGRRDPFRSFEWDRLGQAAEDETLRGPLEQFDVTQLSLVAIVWNTGNARALVQDPSGVSYIISTGARIGKNEGRVTHIADNLVVVKETYVDYLGQETTKDIEMRIRRSEGG